MQARIDSGIRTADGITLHISDFYPAQAATASVMLMHGLGEHSGRYQHVVAFFCARGFAVRTYDHRGHGRSGGPRGDVPDDAAMLDDATLVMQDWLKQANRPSSAPLLFGHSMGGLLAARYAVSAITPLSGLILSSPALALPLSGAQKLLLKVLTKLAPGLAVSNGLKRRYLSHDKAAVDAYNHDPLVHGKITARLLQAMLTSIAIVQNKAKTLNTPTLLLYAGDDHLIDPSGSAGFFGKLTAGVGSTHCYERLYHEIFNEVKADADRVFADLDHWLATQWRQLA